MIDVKTLKVIRKKNKGVPDPPRHPHISNKYEGQFKKDYVNMMTAMVQGIAKQMSEYV